jgi:hypothetical protein
MQHRKLAKIGGVPGDDTDDCPLARRPAMGLAFTADQQRNHGSRPECVTPVRIVDRTLKFEQVPGRLSRQVESTFKDGRVVGAYGLDDQTGMLPLDNAMEPAAGARIPHGDRDHDGLGLGYQREHNDR